MADNITTLSGMFKEIYGDKIQELIMGYNPFIWMEVSAAQKLLQELGSLEKNLIVSKKIRNDFIPAVSNQLKHVLDMEEV